MKKELVFNNVTNIRELKQTILNKCYNELLNDDFNENLEEAMNLLDNLTEQQTKKLIKTVHKIDEIYEQTRLVYKKELKLNSIFNTIIYIGKYFDIIRKYKLREIAILSSYSILSTREMLEEELDLFSKNIIATVIKKDTDFLIQRDMLEMFEYKMFYENKTEEESIEFLNNNSVEEIYSYIIEMRDKTWFQELAKEGWSI